LTMVASVTHGAQPRPEGQDVIRTTASEPSREWEGDGPPPAVDVGVEDPEEQPRFRAVFSYSAYLEVLRLVSVRVDVIQTNVADDRGPETDDQLGAMDLRRGVPWGRWEKAARATAATFLWPPRTGTTPGEGGMDERLAAVAEEYRRNMLEGVRDPAAAIARAHGVEAQTARLWLLRARQLGFLGPARGPTPGESGPPSTA